MFVFDDEFERRFDGGSAVSLTNVQSEGSKRHSPRKEPNVSWVQFRPGKILWSFVLWNCIRVSIGLCESIDTHHWYVIRNRMAVKVKAKKLSVLMKCLDRDVKVGISKVLIVMKPVPIDY